MPLGEGSVSDSAEGTDFVDVGNNGDSTEDDELRRQALKREDVRLKTFKDWPCALPVQPSELAKQGFYYLGIGDKVKCIFCNLILKSWEAGDVVNNEHQKFNPNCAFLLRQDVGNVELEVAAPREAAPKHAEYASVEAREASFTKVPHGTFQQSPRLLAEAGFYYSGYADCVQCYYCGGNLRNWEPGDDPWEEHQHWFPTCHHVKSRPESRDSFPVTAVIQKCLDMGYDKQLVKNVVSKRRRSGSEYDDVNTLVDEVEKLRIQQETLSRYQSVASEMGGAAGPSGGPIPKPVAIGGASCQNQDYQQLKEERICKICMERPVTMTFIPCGHLVTCEVCSSRVQECPMCRQRIRATIRTYFG